jgi:CubicO group peptidase (beta-lactamase class C family)
MYSYRLKLAVLGLLIMLWPAAAATARPQAAAPTDFTEIDAYVEAEMRATRVPGIALAILQGETIIHMRGFGAADETGRPVTPQTPFVLGSLSKSFTALAVMQVVEANKLDLDTPVQHYLPWFQVADATASAQITPRHLLNHTSGLPRQACDQAGQMGHDAGALERNVRALANVAPNAPPGTRYQYCNSNYQVLGLLIERASGQPYDAYVQEHIFAPLDMAHSYTSRAAAAQDGLALGHRVIFGFMAPAYDHPYFEGALPSGYLITTAEDMAHFLTAQLNRGRYQDRELISPLNMLAMHVPPSQVPSDYAMGWGVGKFAGQRILQHSGAVADFISEMWLLPDRGYGIIVLQNARSTLFGNRPAALGLGVVSRLLGQEQPAVPPDAQSWIGLGLLALMTVWQGVSLTAGRRVIRGRGNRSGGWWLGLVTAAGLDVVVCWVCLSVMPAMAESSLLVMLVYSPDITGLMLVLAAVSAFWGTVRTVSALMPAGMDLLRHLSPIPQREVAR